MVAKKQGNFEETRQVKNKEKSTKYILRGQINVRYHNRVLSRKKKSYNFFLKVFLKKFFHKNSTSQLSNLLFLAYLSEHSW